MTDIPAPQTCATDIFKRVVCGIDLSAASLDASRQAAQLLSEDGSLVLVTVAAGEPTALVSPGGFGASLPRIAVDAPTRARYEAALLDGVREVGAAVPRPRTRLLDGDPIIGLLEAIDAESATLAVVGSHAYHRVSGIVLGSVATHLLHKAPCSVLVTRPRRDRPGRILVGIDGSSESLYALEVATILAGRLDRGLVTLVAYGGKPVHDLDVVKRLIPAIETFDAPVHALASEADCSDLIVVGSRRLHGVRAVGSVSERIAHRAPCWSSPFANRARHDRPCVPRRCRRLSP